ncbi:MAG: SDR family NAD-dependent epimerase/dehydratase, partial [Gammaproteobacteria bacterium]
VALMGSPAGFTGPVNLGNPAEITILELARRIIELCGSRSRIVHKPLPVDDPERRQPDITLAKEALGWAPTTDLDTGLKATIAYFDALLGERAKDDSDCRGSEMHAGRIVPAAVSGKLPS